MSGGTVLAVAMTATAGLAGSIQVAIMGRFGERIGVFEALAFATVLTAILSCAALLVVRRSLVAYSAGLHVPQWLWLAGVMGLIVILSITYATPRLGATATIGLLIAGQLTMGAVIDRFGLFGLERIPIGWPRLLGITLLALGAALSLRK
ncbi:MAG TPA: DMT family transporter [Gaiellaceae bacterium]|jgi:transporter family-2 protein|nr:DMT family transporter [Gaiellaceae bacterium]